VAAAANPGTHLDADEPNLSVGRALIVILLIHIVAVGGYLIHKNFLAGNASEASVVAAQPALVDPVPQDASLERLPILRTGDQPYMVQTGDTYARIASARGVAEEDLRRINENIPLRSGRILKMPGRRILALEPVEMQQIRTNGQVSAERGNVEDLNPRDAAIPTAGAPGGPIAASTTAATATAATATAATATATATDSTPLRAIVVNEAPATATLRTAPATHVVVSGDTLWGIATKYKVSADELMKVNQISDAKKLKLGMTLKVPPPR